MTSSPGLASALETANVHASEVSDKYKNATEEEKQNVLDLLKLDSKYEDLTIENTPQLTPQMKKDYVNQATSIPVTTRSLCAKSLITVTFLNPASFKSPDTAS